MFNFLRDTNLYIVETNNSLGMFKHNIPVYSDVSFSQTFNENRTPTKTLHNLGSLYSISSINKANPASFSFTTPVFKDEAIYPIILDLGTKLNTNSNLVSFDIYIESTEMVLRIENCVIETLTFNISRTEVLTISVSGSGKKITNFTDPIPGTLKPVPTQYSVVRGIELIMDSVTLDSIAALNVEYSNEVSWRDTDTIHEALDMVVSYPASFSLSGINLFGSFTEFITDTNISQFNDNGVSSSLLIKVYADIGATPILSFDIDNIAYTRRINTGDIITRVYDYAINGGDTLVYPNYSGFSTVNPEIIIDF